MINCNLIREFSNDYGTFGHIEIDGHIWATGELPWRDNKNGISCIPTGTYKVAWLKSPTKGWCYHILNVQGRDGILIHKGNYCGDINKGYKSDIKGCILLGLGFKTVRDQTVVADSAAAIKKFIEYTKNDDLNITIVGVV
jgi:hypothetical protein